MKKVNVPVLILAVVAILAFGFYWFQIRPNQLREKCYKENMSTSNLYGNIADRYSGTDSKTIAFDNCLKRYGVD
jgi:hypothetical protein